MRRNILLLVLFTTLSNLIFGQNNEEELKQYKQFLPFIIKGIQESKNNPKTEKLDNRVAGLFTKPWEVKKLDKETVKSIINAIVENSSYNMEQDYRQNWNLDFYSKINENSLVKDVFKSDGILSNAFVSLSEINLRDEKGNQVLENGEGKVKLDQSNNINFHSGGINVDIPLEKEFKSISGNIKVTLKEYKTVDYKVFNKKDADITFDLGDNKRIKLFKIENGKAYFSLPTSIENIEITSTNKENEKYAENAVMSIPKDVYEFGMKDDLNDKSIKPFVEKLSIEDIKEKPQMLIYQTNGSIENLYIYLKSSPVELASRIVEVNL